MNSLEMTDTFHCICIRKKNKPKYQNYTLKYKLIRTVLNRKLNKTLSLTLVLNKKF